MKGKLMRGNWGDDDVYDDVDDVYYYNCWRFITEGNTSNRRQTVPV